MKQSFFHFIIALRDCSFETTREFSVLCFFTQNKHFMKNDVVSKDAAVTEFSLSAMSFS